MSNQFALLLKSLVAEGRAKAALQILSDFLKTRDKTLLNESLLLRSNLEDAESAFYTGVAGRVETAQAVAKVKMGILNLADEASRLPHEEGPVLERAQTILAEFGEKEFEASRPERQRHWLWLLGVLALVVVAWLFYRQAFIDKIPEATPQETPPPQMTLKERMDNAEAYYLTHAIYARQGFYQQALDTLNLALALWDKSAKYYNARANILFNLREYAKAKQDATRATTLDPRFAESYVTLAQCCSRLNDVECFYRNIEEALKKHFKVWKYDQQPGILEHAEEKRYQELILQYRDQ